MSILKIGLIGIAGVLLALQIKGTKAEYGVYISIATTLVLLFYAVGKLEIVIETIKSIQSYISIHTGYINTLLKMIGITYVAEFSSNICKDAGYQSIANQIELFGKLSVLAISMPVLTALLETIEKFLG